MRKYIYLIISLAIWPLKSWAALLNNDVIAPTKEFANNVGYNVTKDPSISIIIGAVIQYILGFVGMIFLILVISGGMQWMTAGGNTEKINKARGRIINAAIGLAITIAAYAIVWFISNVLFTTIFDQASPTVGS